MTNGNTIHVTGRPLGAVRHICAFFHSKEEEYRALLGFIKEGIEHREKAFHIVDAKQCHSHRARLEREGIDVPAAEKSGQLRVACWEDAYLKDGHFDQNRQINLIESVLKAGKEEGFPITRLVANMEWALEDKAGVEDIVEYESRLNYVLPEIQ